MCLYSRKKKKHTEESYIQDFLVGLWWRGLSENFDGYWDLHILAFRDPQTLNKQTLYSVQLARVWLGCGAFKSQVLDDSSISSAALTWLNI